MQSPVVPNYRAPLNHLRKDSRSCSYRVRLALITAERNSEVREVRLITDTLRNVRWREIAHQGSSSVRFEARIDQRNGDASYGTYLDRYRIVEDPAPVRKSREVASYDPENVRVLRRCYGHVQTQQIRLGLTGEILESANDPSRYARE